MLVSPKLQRENSYVQQVHHVTAHIETFPNIETTEEILRDKSNSSTRTLVDSGTHSPMGAAFNIARLSRLECETPKMKNLEYLKSQGNFTIP